MTDSEATLKARRTWVMLYKETGNAGLTCRRCGISRPTLRKWWRRYQEAGEQGLQSRSRRRKRLPAQKVTAAHEELILTTRKERRLGPKRLQSELRRLHDLRFSTATLWKVLHRHGVSAGVRPRRRVRGTRRYSRPVPGDRVQIDSCKIHKGLYQFTAVDDCTRLRVLGLYPNRKQQSAIDFLKERVLLQLPFPVQRVQTDRGPEFIGEGFQKALRERRVKFRPIRPRSPHLNGKVERSQQTDRVEFWATVDRSLPREALEPLLEGWQRHYNEERPHSSLAGKTPAQRRAECSALIPSEEQVRQDFDPAQERWHTNWPYTWTFVEGEGFSLKRCR